MPNDKNGHKLAVETLVNTALASITNRQEKVAFMRMLATYSFVKISAFEGTPAAAMAAYSLGDHLVDPKKELRKS